MTDLVVTTPASLVPDWGTPQRPQAELNGDARPSENGLQGGTPAWIAFLTFLLGALLITYAYSEASVNSGLTHYTIFWAGMIIGIGPTAVIALSRYSNRQKRFIFVLATALLTFLPKFLLSIHGPIYSDEDAHFRELEEIIRTGHLYQPNALVDIAQQFPGLESTTTAIHALSGLDAWQSALITLLIAHCLAPVIVYLLGERLGLGPVAATIAAIVYMANPSYMFFDAQYAYESLGIAFVLATLLCLVAVLRARIPREAVAFAILGTLTGMATVVTHHLSAIALIAFMVVILIFLWPRGAARRHSARNNRRANLICPQDGQRRGPNLGGATIDCGKTRLMPIAVPSTVQNNAPTHVDFDAALCSDVPLLRRCAIVQISLISATLAGWFTLMAPDTYSHLAPFLGGGLSQVGAATGVVSVGSTTTTVRRTLLQASTLPSYETLAIRAFPLIAAAVCAVAGFYWLKRRRLPRTLWPVFTLALLYFVSLPLDLTVKGASGAHRSWSFSFIFLALAMGVGLECIVGFGRGRQWAHRLAVVVAGGALLVTFAGNISANTNADARFGGPYLWGTESREPTPETEALARWFNQTLPYGTTVMVDHFTGIYLYSHSGVRVPPPSFDLVTNFDYSDQPIPTSIWNQAIKQGYQYIVVDKRFGNHLGVWNSPFVAPLQDVLPQPGALTRFQQYSWTPRVYNSTDYSVYRIDARALPGGPAS